MAEVVCFLKQMYQRYQRLTKIDALVAARDIIERRVNFFCVSEPNVQTIQSGSSHRISVSCAWCGRCTRSGCSLLAQHCTAQFKEYDGSRYSKQHSSPSTGQLIVQIFFKNNSKTTHILASFKPSGLNGSHVKRKPHIQFNTGSGKSDPSVQLVFNKEGAKLFEDI